MPQTILLTGASGYIAKHIALQLLDAGHHVRGSVRSQERATEVTAAMRAHVRDTSDLDQRLSLVMLDLTKDEGWDDAMEGIDVVMHTASPFPMVQPSNADDVIEPAVQGTMRALHAANRAGIKRVIITSSTAAINGSRLPQDDVAYNETNWTDADADGVAPYVRSKTLAERAAWNFVRDEAPDMQVTTINPGMVLGAPLDKNFGTSIAAIARMLRAKDPMLPDSGFPVVDVLDVAELHLVAMDKPETAGQRIMAVDKFLKFKEIADAIKASYPKQKIVHRVAPNIFIKLVGMFDPSVRSIVPSLGRVDKMDNTRAIAIFGRGMRQAQKAAVSSAKFLIEQKMV